MKTVKLDNGFEVKVEPEQLNDMYFVEELARLETDALALPKVVTMLFGEDQKKALYKHLEDESGRVRLEAVTDAITEVMTKAGEDTKN